MSDAGRLPRSWVMFASIVGVAAGLCTILGFVFLYGDAIAGTFRDASSSSGPPAADSLELPGALPKANDPVPPSAENPSGDEERSTAVSGSGNSTPSQHALLIVSSVPVSEDYRERYFTQTTMNSTRLRSLPSDLSTYSLAAVEVRAAGGPSARTALMEYVSNGGGLLIESGDPYYLCGYSLSGCLPFGERAGYANVPAGTSAKVASTSILPTAPASGECIYSRLRGDGGAAVRNWGPDATAAAVWSDGTAYALLATYGSGRIAWMANLGEDPGDACIKAHTQLTEGILRWLSG